MSIPLASLLSLTEADSVAGFECPTDSGLAHHAHLYCSDIDRREAVTECAHADARLPSCTGLHFVQGHLMSCHDQVIQCMGHH